MNQTKLLVKPIDKPYPMESVHLVYDRIKTPLSDTLVAVTKQSIEAVELPLQLTFLGLCERQDSQVTSRSSDAVLEDLKQLWRGAQFEQGPLDKVAVALFNEADERPIELWLKGTSFQIDVWKALLTIPKGSTRSYRDLAISLGRPKGAQAVGQAVAKNSIAILVPCHRVVNVDAGLGNYRWGRDKKKQLLDAEQQQTAEEEEPLTDFGFDRVSAKEKGSKVNQVFDSVAERYDLMNDLMSAGVHRLWKKMAVASSGVRKGDYILDIAGGTGDLAGQYGRIVGPEGRVILADINANMLALGRDKLLNRGLGSELAYVQADAQCLPFADNSFDAVSIAFGLRNLVSKEQALSSIWRVLKPGGRVLILEFSKPIIPLLSKMYNFYSFNVLPLMGKLIVDDEQSYRYLVESIRRHPDQDSLLQILKDSGFHYCDYSNMSGGIVALHRGFKT